MNKTFILLSLLLAANGVLGDPALLVRFAYGLDIGNSFFIPMPLTLESAISEDYDWMSYDRPTKDRESLDMYCARDGVIICTLYDDNGFLAGLQIAIEKVKFDNAVFDWLTLGFTSWSVEVNGETREFWVTNQYFVSDSYLALSQDERLAAYDRSVILQEDMLWVNGIDGELVEIPINDDDILAKGFTLQNCIPWMGHHFYFNITKDTQCIDANMFPWSPLVKSGEMIGCALDIIGNITLDDNEINYFEYNTEEGIRMTFKDGPECLFDLARSPGIITMHIYYISDPYRITCKGQQNA